MNARYAAGHPSVADEPNGHARARRDKQTTGPRANTNAPTGCDTAVPGMDGLTGPQPCVLTYAPPKPETGRYVK